MLANREVAEACRQAIEAEERAAILLEPFITSEGVEFTIQEAGENYKERVERFSVQQQKRRFRNEPLPTIKSAMHTFYYSIGLWVVYG